MSGKRSWLEYGLGEELGSLDLSRVDYLQVEEPLGPGENSLGVMNEIEKRLFVLCMLYLGAEETAAKKRAIADAKLCNIRADIIRNLFYFRVAERLKVWETDVTELEVRHGWQIVSIDRKQKEKVETAQTLFSLMGNKKNDRVM